jgi:hypothetical protein
MTENPAGDKGKKVDTINENEKEEDDEELP